MSAICSCWERWVSLCLSLVVHCWFVLEVQFVTGFCPIQILYVIRPAIYALLRCRHYRRDVSTSSIPCEVQGQGEKDSCATRHPEEGEGALPSSNGDPLSPVWRWLAGRDQADLLLALAVSLVSLWRVGSFFQQCVCSVLVQQTTIFSL